ncbi:MAG: FAD binding domain-containing protein, partial [Actinomycetota bacterium]
MIHFPESYADIDVPDGAVVRSGGTDLQERLRSLNAAPTIVDLTGVAGFAGIASSATGVRIGGGTRMAVVASELADSFPALAIATGSLATPQVRAIGTIAGNLTQHTRCWYYRHPDTDPCFKTGGDSCPARTGRHLYGNVFDTSDCVHPHPSTIAMALRCYDSTIELADGARRSLDEVLGDGSDPTCDHQLADGDVIAAIEIADPWVGERAAYFRSISRFEAEWPLVEAVARARFDGDTVAECALAIGDAPSVQASAARWMSSSSSVVPTSVAAAASIASGTGPTPPIASAHSATVSPSKRARA